MKSTHGGEGGKKCLVGPKEQRKWQEEHMEGTGGSRGCAGIWAVPRQGPALPSLLLGVPPCPNPGGSGRRWYHSHQPLTARAVLAAKSSLQLQVGPRAGSRCFVPVWGMLGAVSGVWSSTWELKTANGDIRMESPSCGSTPGEGGEMDGEGKQNQTSMILCVNDYLTCGSGFW